MIIISFRFLKILTAIKLQIKKNKLANIIKKQFQNALRNMKNFRIVFTKYNLSFFYDRKCMRIHMR